MTHICVSKLTIIGSNDGLSPGLRHAIIWTNDGISLIGPLGTIFNDILIEIHRFSFKKIHSKCRLENDVHFLSASMCFNVYWCPGCVRGAWQGHLQTYYHHISHERNHNQFRAHALIFILSSLSLLHLGNCRQCNRIRTLMLSHPCLRKMRLMHHRGIFDGRLRTILSLTPRKKCAPG